MMEEQDYIAGLIGKHLENSLNTEERTILDAWINASENNRITFEQLNDPQQLVAGLKSFYTYDTDRIARRISEQVPAFAMPETRPVYPMRFVRKWGWAAAVALLLGGSTYFLVMHKKTPLSYTAGKTTIMPGMQGAILTLADGSEVVLDSISNGVVAKQNGASIVMANGKLAYDPAGSLQSAPEYNKMTTPRGRQFEMMLPDGTKVWLNAGSTIRYPTAFNGNERDVEVSGEVFFDVVKDATKPFFVHVINNKAAIAVLGTTFNISAYENENAINTTLLSGSVKVFIPSTIYPGLILKNGQQAMITHTPDTQLTIVANPDLEKIMAWKNGLFNFEGANLEEVMRQLERWYNIDVVYENGIPDIKFMGEMSRQIPLEDLLEILKRTEVDFRVEGRKLIVLNK